MSVAIVVLCPEAINFELIGHGLKLIHRRARPYLLKPIAKSLAFFLGFETDLKPIYCTVFLFISVSVRWH